jgi:ABC-type branched-subunit amino acid transport system ATPase component
VDAVISLINEIKATGVTIVMIEHVMRALMQLSDRVLIMNHGKQLFLGRPDEVLKDEEVIKVYLGSESLVAHESSR